MKNKIVFFDFDGTITYRDSLIDFIRFAVGNSQFILGICYLLPMLVLFKLKLIPNDKAKEKMLSYFFKDMEISQFKALAQQYSSTEIDKILRPKAIKKIKAYQDEGYEVVVVSASMECWLSSWCKKQNITLIATKLEVKDNKLTGKFATKNCHGEEKVKRIKVLYELDTYSEIHAYGDSQGDKALLALADKSFYKPFRS